MPGDSEQRIARCAVSLTGSVDTKALRGALHQAVEQHEILRTVFRRQPGMKDPFQVILEEPDVAWDYADRTWSGNVDQSAAIHDVFKEGSTHDLENGPVLRCVLAHCGPAHAILFLSLPALCSDVRGLQILVSEIGRRYDAIVSGKTLTIEGVQYVDVSEWQNELLVEPESNPGCEFWRDYLRRADLDAWHSFSLPFQIQPLKHSQVHRLSVGLASADVANLDTFCATNDSCVDAVLLTSWQVFLSRIGLCPHVPVSCLFDGRNYSELEGALGLLSWNLPIWIQLEPEMEFSQVLKRVSSRFREMRQWQQCFAALVDENNKSQITSLPLGFAYEEYGEAEEYGGVKFRLLEAAAAGEPHTLKLTGRRRGERLSLEFAYDAGTLERATVERWNEQFQTLLAGALANPETPVSRLPLIAEPERRRLLVDWNRTEAEYARERTICELFEAQAARTPERLAVRCGEQALSYRELNEQANQWARYLQQLGVGPNQRVGLCLERSLQSLVGMLAIGKAGAAYVVLNADHPPARLKQQLEGAVALLTDQHLAAQLPQFGGAVVCVDRDAARWRELPSTNLPTAAKPDDLVYVIYTSGSTGVPKGVMVRHRNLVNYAQALLRRLPLDACGQAWQFATVSTLSADLGNSCIYPAWFAGGCVHLIRPEVASDPQALGAYCTRYGVDVLKMVPSHLRALLDAGGGREMLPRRYLILGGEMLTRALVERIEALGSGCQLINHYGPTETTVGSVLLALGEYDWRRLPGPNIPIGRPLANTRLYVLDAYQQPLPLGIEGELYIGGAGVAAGYLEQPQETAARFVPDLAVAGERMYRTGDRVRYLSDGTLEFLGRWDEQVKIRGYRVEPGELEAVLAEHPGVRQAAVLVRELAGDKQLVAYVVSRPEANLTGEDLQRYLKTRLPDYLLPAGLVLLPKLPLTANGKLDRQALPLPEEAIQAHRYEPPQTAAEEQLATIWSQVLRRERIGRHDNFFDIGGHSLLATQIVAR
ncbi:MAG: amino acid adenylation domain-containing protein, partial [Acidobacteriia bacterium]|nr:amino acid adenylation domain-containing protein [Terriglobia bacterium]